MIHNAVENQGIDLGAIHHVHEWLRPNSPFWANTAQKYEYVRCIPPGLISPPLIRWFSRIKESREQGASRGLCDIHKEVVLLPTGTWHPDPAVQQVGGLITRAWMIAYKQLEPLLVENGLTPEQANQVVTAAINELRQTERQILAKYHMIYGTKI